MSEFNFAINIGGNAAGALTAASKGFAEADKGAHKAAEGVKLFETEAGKLSKTIGGLTVNMAAVSHGGAFFTFDLAEGMRAAYEVASRLVEKTIDLGKEFVVLMGKTQDLNLAVRLNVGPEAAEEINKIADGLSSVTRFDDDLFKRGFLDLERAGVKDAAFLEKLGAGAADVAALTAGGPEAVTEALNTFANIATKRQVNAKMLKEFRLNEGDVVKNLADLLRTSPKNAKKQMESGKLSAQTLLSVVLDELGKPRGGVGGAGLEARNTIGGSLQKLADLPENLFKRLADSPAVASIQHALDNFIDLMEKRGPAIIDRFGKALDQAFGSLTAGDVDGAIEGTISVLEGIWWVAKAVAWTVTGIVHIFEGWAYVGDKLGDALGWLTTMGPELGHDLVAGIADGIRGAFSSVKDAIVSLGDSTIGWFKDKLGIASPSKVFRELGGYVGEGYALGVEDSADRVDRAHRSLDFNAPVAAGGSAPGGAGSVTINWTGNVVVESAGAADDDAIRAAQATRAEVLKMLREVGYALGAPA